MEIIQLTIVIALCALSDGAYNLTCYTCKTTSETSTCVVNATEITQTACQPHEKYCKVYRIETVGVFTSLERSCAASCKAQCGVWGDEHDTEHCVSCCDEPLCNTNDVASTLTLTQTTLSVLLLLYFFFL